MKTLFGTGANSRRVAVTALAAATLVVTGCSDNAPTGESSESSDAAPASSVTGAAAPEISGAVDWAMLTYDDGVKPWAEDVIARFEEKYPGVEVNLTMPPVNEYLQLMTTQVRGGNPPDIAAMATAWVPAFADAGALQPWDTVLDASALESIDPVFVEGGKVAGDLVALPYLSTSRALFWNKEAFAKAGIDGPPSTWDEVISDSKLIQESGAAKYGFALEGKGVEAFSAWFPYFYWSYGGELTDSSGNLAIDQEICTQALTTLDTIVKSGVTNPNIAGSDNTDQLQAFSSGDAAMTITGPWFTGTLGETGIDYGVAPIPAGTTSATLNVSDAYVLFKDGGNPTAAAALAAFLSDPANSDQFVEGRGMLPVMTEGFDAPRYQDDPLRTFVELLPGGKFAPISADWLSLSDQGTRALQSMYTDGTSPADTCSAIRSEA